MLWFLYNILFAISYLLLLPHFVWRMLRRGGYRAGFMQRFGLYSPAILGRLQGQARIWIHAVSVGEVYVALHFMQELRKADPRMAFVLTTTTSTGHALAARSLSGDDVLLYYPCDFPLVVNRALEAIRPTAVVLVECELWPNLIRSALCRGIPAALVNGRISDLSYRGYRKVRVFAARVLKAMPLLLVQTPTDAQRLLSLGARPESVRVMGIIKYDVANSELTGTANTSQVLAACGIGAGSPVIVGGSTWPGEETILLDVFRQLRKGFPALKLILVPRHAERAAEVEAEIRRVGFGCVRRSALNAETETVTPAPDVLLVDTTGELCSFYACASAVFVGKSLAAHGGQNIIEPAALGKAIITGPHMENFADVTADFLDAQALVQVSSAQEAVQAFERLLSDAGLCAAYGERAKALVASKRGAMRRSAEMIRGLVEGRVPGGQNLGSSTH